MIASSTHSLNKFVCFRLWVTRQPTGVTEGSWIPVAPLEWRCLEKVVYSNDCDEGQGDDKEDEGHKPVTFFPPIKAILRVPQEPVEPVGKERKKRREKSPIVDSEFLPSPEAG